MKLNSANRLSSGSTLLKQIASVLLLTGFTLLSCSQTDSSLQPDLPFDCSLRVLHPNGTADSLFAKGENFILSFIIVNKSDRNASLVQFQDDDFLRVYRTDVSAEVRNNRLNVGRPYKTMFCTYQLGVFIPAHDTLKLEIPWMPSDTEVPPHFCLLNKNEPLPAGVYETEFSEPFQFVVNGDSTATSPRLSFKTKFQIK